MSRQFFSGNSIEQAIMAAARHHSIEPEKVAYSVRDKKHGFLNIRRRVVIEVDPQKPELTEEERAQAATPKPTSPSAKPAPEARAERARPTRDVDDAEDDPGDDYRHDGDGDDDDFEDFEDRDERDDGDFEDGDEGDADDESFDDEDIEDEAETAAASDEDDDQARSADERPAGRGRRGKKSRDRQDRQDRRRGRGRDEEEDGDGEVRNYRGIKVSWEDEVELDGVSREMAAFEFAVEQILDVMDLEIEYTIVEGETFKIEFSGEDADLLTEDDGRVLKAFEHVLPRIVRGLVGDSLNCKVDCEGFRAEHEDQLVELAQDAADEVRESGDAKVLPQMNPSDRRIIHLALVNDPDVETVSQGRGYMKRVRVQLIDEA